MSEFLRDIEKTLRRQKLPASNLANSLKFLNIIQLKNDRVCWGGVVQQRLHSLDCLRQFNLVWFEAESGFLGLTAQEFRALTHFDLPSDLYMSSVEASPVAEAFMDFVRMKTYETYCVSVGQPVSNSLSSMTVDGASMWIIGSGGEERSSLSACYLDLGCSVSKYPDRFEAALPRHAQSAYFLVCSQPFAFSLLQKTNCSVDTPIEVGDLIRLPVLTIDGSQLSLLPASLSYGKWLIGGGFKVDFSTTEMELNFMITQELMQESSQDKSLQMSLSIRLGEISMSLNEAKSLVEGATIPLPAGSWPFVVIESAGKPVAKGELVLIGTEVAVQVCEMF